MVQLPETCNLICDDRIHSILHTLPKGLATTFERIPGHVARSGKAHVVQKSFARYALSSRRCRCELPEALAVEVGQQGFLRKRLIQRADRLLK